MRHATRAAVWTLVMFLSSGSLTYAVNPEQCLYFAADGKVTVCHATASARNPYVILRISVAACVDSHADHSADFVSIGDPSCGGVGCLPEAAPCDATLPCCDGLACTQGSCVPVVVEPAISPIAAERGSFFTITDPQGRIEPGSVVLFYKLGMDPALEGTTANNVTISTDHTTLTGSVPNGAIDGDNFVRVAPDRANAGYFADLLFTVQ